MNLANVTIVLRVAASACLWLMMTSAFGADTMDEGRAAYAAGDYKTAIAKWQALTKEDRPEGWFYLGVMYAEGKGVARNHAKAFELYSEAAQKNFVPAQYNLGNQYAMGEGVGQDYSKAEYWWTKAAESGLAQAQINLGTLYLYGITGEKDAARARKWLSLAAAQGSPEAKELIAKLDAESPPPAPAVTTVAAAPAAPVARTVTTATAAPAVAAAAAASGTAEALRREAWTLAQPASRYTIQVLATGTDATARDYIKQHSLAELAAYIEGAAQGATVYRVIYGSYASRDQAEKALAALPRAMTSNAPWVRSFAEVHKLLDKRYADRGAP